ncbi:ABC transporter substrate-binding protein [Vitreoscilla stercoraria]|uniref:ABC transporter substrate-binding protein n=1 Tax=Vitreoscilla stercoraria TaxID=61 RepID=A0ABY4EBR1_VITST|nr:ABC transporter substrate-binding protein [Vitreoscilla stercoraria]UOO93188.1 ABC transporter substrate-binding protein [Vitreoscilla stercoraria]
MKFASIALCLSSLFAVAACGQSNQTTSNAATDTQASSNTHSNQRSFTIAATGGNYQDAIRTLYFKPFSEKIKQPVLDEVFDGGFGIIQAKVQGGNANWDVVQMEAQDLIRACDDGLLEPLDWAKLGGKESFIDSATFSECGVGSIMWSTAIVYDGNKLQDGPKSWADFWDLKQFPGKRSLRKTPEYALEAALLADGVQTDQVYPLLETEEGINRAFKKLDEIKSQVLWWDSGAQPLQFLASGEVSMAAAFNGRVTGMNRTEGTNFKIVWNESLYGIDSWTILKGSPYKDVGMDFIAYATSADIQSKLPETQAYGITNKAAISKVSPQLAADLPSTPANMQGAFAWNATYWVDRSEELTARFNAWLAN